jgi:hypothetical protein
MALAFFEHIGEFCPGLRCRVLAAKLALAVAPAAAGDDRGYAPVGAAGENRYRRAEAAADERDALRVNLGPSGQV